MDGTLTIPDEPLIASPDDAAPMPDDSLPAPEPNDEHSATPDASQPVEIIPMRVVEAILFAADSPLPPNKIASILGVGDAREVRKHIAALNELYEAAGNAFRIEEIAGGFRMMTLPPFNRWLTKLLRARQETKLTGASMETLAIVAYKQPCTRADIEAVRGVAAGDMLNRLREMNLIKIVGRAEDLGRPLLYGTTKRFLEVFGLAGLEDLPQVDALRGGSVAGPSETDASGESMASRETTGPVETLDAGEGGGVGGEVGATSELKIADGDVNTRDFDMHEGGVAGSASAEASPMDAASETPVGEQLREASADLAQQQGHGSEHPPPKAVVTPRPRRNRKPKDEPPAGGA
jgi:segregation and condensation protein B